MSNLSHQTCIPCRGGVPALGTDEIETLLLELPAWRVVDVSGKPRLRRAFRFSDFATALEFTVRVGEVAERQDHHPRIVTQWGSVTVDWWTHAAGGLHRNDFIMAAKTDEVAAGLPRRDLDR